MSNDDNSSDSNADTSDSSQDTVTAIINYVKIFNYEHKFKNCSTAMLAITFALFVGYSVAKAIQNRKTSFGQDVTE